MGYFALLMTGMLCIAGCKSEDNVSTLYRRSLITPARIHVATFDAKNEATGYNSGNCAMVVKYMTMQPEVPDGYYWCEAGHFRP